MFQFKCNSKLLKTTEWNKDKKQTYQKIKKTKCNFLKVFSLKDLTRKNTCKKWIKNEHKIIICDITTKINLKQELKIMKLENLRLFWGKLDTDGVAVLSSAYDSSQFSYCRKKTRRKAWIRLQSQFIFSKLKIYKYMLKVG